MQLICKWGRWQLFDFWWSFFLFFLAMFCTRLVCFMTIHLCCLHSELPLKHSAWWHTQYCLQFSAFNIGAIFYNSYKYTIKYCRYWKFSPGVLLVNHYKNQIIVWKKMLVLSIPEFCSKRLINKVKIYLCICFLEDPSRNSLKFAIKILYFETNALPFLFIFWIPIYSSYFNLQDFGYTCK